MLYCINLRLFFFYVFGDKMSKEEAKATENVAEEAKVEEKVVETPKEEKKETKNEEVQKQESKEEVVETPKEEKKETPKEEKKETPKEEKKLKSSDSDDEASELLVATEKYLKSGIHIGTKFKTKFMNDFIYKIRPDGLAVLNLQKIDERINVCANFLAQYDPKDIMIVSRRENGWRPVKMFGRLTGCRIFAGRYPPGILTNTALSDFIEAKIVLVTDPWPDRNVILDAKKVGLTVIGLCDTNNVCNNLDLVVPCNNKGKKSLGLLFWILAKLFLQNKGLLPKGSEMKETPEDFSGE